MASILSKRNILITLVFVLAAIWFTAGRMLFPMNFNFDLPENPVRDRAEKDWAAMEAEVPTDSLKNVYWGDLHVHTSLSFDAYLAGTMRGPEDAYRFAMGEPVPIFGRSVRMARPLDFTAVTDHSELIGEMYTVQTPGAPGYKAFVPRYFRSVYNDKKEFGINTKVQRDIFGRALKRGGRGNPRHPGFFQGFGTTVTSWDVILQAAEEYYRPGKFTTLAGFEWSLLDGNAHLHRNVIFRDMVVPDYPMSSLELGHEEALWTWLDSISAMGSTVMAIPHNTNLAEGGAFRDVAPDGRPMDRAYAQLRQDYEPVIEVHQAKGGSEVHPALWSNDEFAGFENYSFGSPREDNYVRWALKKGLELDSRLGVNPFKFGMIGSTDTHTGTPGNAEESDTFISNQGIVDFVPEDRASLSWNLSGSKKEQQVVMLHELLNPGGLVAVWAPANTRSSIYDGLKNREVYATSGTRIVVRFFGGSGFSGGYGSADDLVEDGYRNGVPMGGDLVNPGEPPQFLIYARKDAEGANLDRVQLIKGTYLPDGELQETIFDVAASDGRVAGPDGRVQPVRAPVDRATGAWDRSKGANEFLLTWTDPDYDPAEYAFYYLRVLELPTASWRLWDVIRYGSSFPDNAALVIQERAWSSPIWIKPAAE